MINILSVWAAEETYDEYGQSRGMIGLFTHESAAIAAAKGRGYYNGDGSTSKRDVIKVGSEYYLLANRIPVTINVDWITLDKQKRANALAKLTPEEKKLLNLKE